MDRQCSSCGGFCRKSGCERENVQPEQEPVAWVVYSSEENDIVWTEAGKKLKQNTPLYTAPLLPKVWVGLTDEDKKQIAIEANNKSEMTAWEYAHRVGNFTEAKLKEKNT